LESSSRRSLQATGVKIDFSVGVSSPARVTASQVQLTQLANGSPDVTRRFVQQLDTELQQRGETPLNLSPAAISFAVPTVTENRSQVGSQQVATSYNVLPGVQNQGTVAANQANKDSSSNSMLFVVAVATLAVFALVYQRGKKTATESAVEFSDNNIYASKTADFGFDEENQNQTTH